MPVMAGGRPEGKDRSLEQLTRATNANEARMLDRGMRRF